MGRLLKIEEVAVRIGSSVKSINNWYWFKRTEPDSDYAKMLPDYIQEGNRQTRYWEESDVWKLIEFKNNLPKGRNGIMGSVTQKYIRTRKEREINAENADS